MKDKRIISRRSFATQGAVLAGSLPLIRMAHANPLEIPRITDGVMCGDVTFDSAVIWSRCDRESRMMVEWSTDEAMTRVKLASGPIATADDDFTARLVLSELPPGERIFYRVWFTSEGGGSSTPSLGTLETAGSEGEDVFFAWSGDTAGQGFGINPEWGGMKIYSAIEKVQPQFFIHSGDMIYADNPIPAELKLNDGSIWKNLVTPSKSHAAATVEDFRGNYLYNLMDLHLKSFHSKIPQYVLWDDHETTNNWYPDQELAARRDAKAYEGLKLGRDLANNAKKAYFEYTPLHPSSKLHQRIYRSFSRGSLLDLFILDLRTYRGANSTNVQETRTPASAILGEEQLNWLKNQLKASKATWKVICSDMPLGLVIGDSMEGKPLYEAVANGDRGVPKGRELEMAELLAWMKESSIKNTIWITADVHYSAAHFYDPRRAAIKDSFLPFWEFVAGPLHAGTFGPSELDGTFGPEVKFNWAPKKGTRLPLAPSDGMQSFGTVRVDARSKRMTVELRNLEGIVLPNGSFELEPDSF